ncbi:hypothetical protein A8A01_29785 [Ewingella americana]|nr:hypothetical protein A8A01_29785 [Ewingella americana]
MRRLSMSNKRPRGVPRRLRWLKSWSESFGAHDYEGVPAGDRYWNWKIPVLENMVQGKHAKRQTKAECAQHMINACQRLIATKPQTDGFIRVTCAIIQPDMFTSEICLYLDEDYFNGHTLQNGTQSRFSTVIQDRSLATEWGLLLPEGITERGIKTVYRDEECPEYDYISECWYFGELL